MNRDDNKGITSIIYNHLNLPTLVDFGGNGKIEYLYNAAGVKLQKKVSSSVVVITDYLNGFQYVKTGTAEVQLEFFPHAEGYVKASGPNRYNYIYNYTDHLGNVRLSYTKDPATNVLTILEENHYYPFGLKHANYNMTNKQYTKLLGGGVIISPVDRNAYKFKFNNREYQDELGLNVTAMDFRNYDMAIGRFNVIDPLAEKAYNLSPYRFGFNSPLVFNDSSGLWEENSTSYTTSNTGEIAAFMSAFNRSEDEEDDRSKLDIYINADKGNEDLVDSYNEVIKTEDILIALLGYSTLRTIDLPKNGSDGWDNLDAELRKLRTLGFTFNSFIIDSHGGYNNPSFYIGESKVNYKNFMNTYDLRNHFKGTSVYILSCHTGGGANLQESMNFTQGLSNLWGANVYTNRSWGPAWVFNEPLKLNWFQAQWNSIGRKNAVDLWGQWLKATPGGNAPTVIYNLILYPPSLLNSNITNTYSNE